MAIKQYIAAYNENPKPFICRKSADEILESLKTYCTRISDAGHHANSIEHFFPAPDDQFGHTANDPSATVQGAG